MQTAGCSGQARGRSGPTPACEPGALNGSTSWSKDSRRRGGWVAVGPGIGIHAHRRTHPHKRGAQQHLHGLAGKHKVNAPFTQSLHLSLAPSFLEALA